MITTPCYATREQVMAAVDFKASARADRRVDDALQAASRMVDDLCHRVFYPTTDTREFDWPDRVSGRSGRLWVDQPAEIVSVATLTSGGTTISSSDYFLEPVNTGPPFDRVDIDLSSSASFDAGDTHQQSIVIAGVFGYDDHKDAAGALAGNVNSSVTTVTVDDAAAVGVGDLITVGTERMLIVERAFADSGQNLQTALTAAKSNVTVAVEDGTAFSRGETILLDSERMLVVDVAGNNLTVERGHGGTVLASHTASDIYRSTSLTVARAATGSTAASHSTSDAVTRQRYPAPVVSLTVAEAVYLLARQTAGYADVSGDEGRPRSASAAGVKPLRTSVRRDYGRIPDLGVAV